MRLSALAASPDDKLVRTIVWESGTRRNLHLAVTLEYIPPAVFAEEQEREKTKVIAKKKLVPMEDVAEIQNAINLVYFRLLADSVQKITLPGGAPVTLNEMRSLLSLNAGQVKAAGGLEAPVAFDLTDKTELTEEDRKKHGVEAKVKTWADVARQNVTFLLKSRNDFRAFVEQTISDVSNFQDGDWEDSLKNS